MFNKIADAAIPRQATIVAGGLGAVLISTVAIESSGKRGFVALTAVAAAVIAIVLLPRLQHQFLVALVGLLTLYALFGRGIAYAGVPPLYIGEMTLGLGLIGVFVGGHFERLTPAWFFVIIPAFMLWGAARTVPFIRTYKVDAIRDAALWIYALFALMVALSVKRRHLSLVAAWYRYFAFAYVLWCIATYLVLDVSPLARLSVAPGVSLLSLRAGESAVHLGGIGAFMALGLNGRRRFPVPEAMLWGLWLVALVTRNRSGMLAALVGLAIALAFQPISHSVRRLLPFAMIAGAVLAGSILLGSSLNLRTGSGQPITQRLTSIFVSTGNSRLDNTREWRLKWWSKIIGYTFDGPYFWTGRGFGLNLATADGFQVDQQQSLRSPHNGNMTVLARMGVPGFTIWILLQLSFCVMLIRALLRARRLSMTPWFLFGVWILAYWSASLVNASFDVYLEGPQGGIWFWCIVGIGIAYLRLECEAEHGLTAVPRVELERRFTGLRAAVAVRPPAVSPAPLLIDSAAYDQRAQPSTPPSA